MPNMSYCRFENTNSDLVDVINVMSDILNGNSNRYELVLSEYELMAFHALVASCNRYIDYYNELVDSNRVITDVELWKRKENN